jgi:hypothetical protein
MEKAEALVAKVVKSGTGKPLTIEQAFEKVFSDPVNRALARAAMRPTSRKGTPSPDEEDGKSPASYDDDGDNTAQNARTAVTGSAPTKTRRAGPPLQRGRSVSAGARPRWLHESRSSWRCAPALATTRHSSTHWPQRA